MFGNGIAFKQGVYKNINLVSGDTTNETEWFYCGTVSQSGVNSSFANLTNLTGDTIGTYAQAGIQANDGHFSSTKTVNATNFGITLDTTNILGIQFQFDYDSSIQTGAYVSFYEYLQPIVSGTPTGTNFGDDSLFLNNASNQTFTIGDSTSLLGLTPTVSDITSSTFGLTFQLYNGGTSDNYATINLKRLGCKIYYN